MRYFSLGCCVSIAIAANAAVSSTNASADILIVESTGPPLKRGDQLGDSERLKIPSNVTVRILRPGGETQVLHGPFDRSVRDITSGEATNQSVWQSIQEQLKSISRSPAGTAATRSMTVDKNPPKEP